MRPCLALLLLCAAAAPPPLEGRSCQVAHDRGYEGHCPVNMTSVLSDDARGIYTVTVRVWMSADDLCSIPRIEIPGKETITPIVKNRKCGRKDRIKCYSMETKGTKVCCPGNARNSILGLWELKADFAEIEAGETLSVNYSATSTNCTVSHIVPDHVPDFKVSVNQSSKIINVTVETEKEVFIRWCYKSQVTCDDSPSPPITVFPLKSQSAVLPLPHLLSCICVQVCYTYTDAIRREMCPFKKDNIMDVRDVWLTSRVTLYQRRLEWRSPCLISNISASLCWMQHEQCTPALNSTLEKNPGPPLTFAIDAVDKHPQMCVQFSLQESYNVTCPFKSEESTWEVTTGPGRRSILVYLSSSAPAEFSAQLCLLSESACSPAGPTQSVALQRNAAEMKINVPSHIFAKKLCVQVWQSDPALQGSRILCPDYVHSRRGMYAVVALVFLVGVVMLGMFFHRVVKSGAAGWLYFQRPLLLVCSSDQSAHVSAVCALASILQEELGATVHTSLWTQTSQTHAGTSVADLGPLPWLYGQWEAVCNAQGKVLIIWSPEAKRTFEKWREARASVDQDEKKVEYQRKTGGRLEKTGAVERGDLKPSRKLLGKCKKEKTAHETNERWQQKESSTVIESVFMASLACLDGALQKCKGQRTSIVYFQGLGHSRDVPKALRGVPRYCLPQDFRGLIQELGRVKTRTKASKFRWHCWPRLLTKVLSIYLARQLARRLQAVLPWTRGLSVSSSVKMTSDKTSGELRLPLAAGTETVAEREPLRESPEEL